MNREGVGAAEIGDLVIGTSGDQEKQIPTTDSPDDTDKEAKSYYRKGRRARKGGKSLTTDQDGSRKW